MNGGGIGTGRRLVVGVSGASGTIYAVRLLELLRGSGVETHLVVSRAGDMTRAHETALSAGDLRGLADVHYAIGDVGAAISSGSFRTMGMAIVPCSVRTLAEIASGVTTSLLTRAADVVLKERRRLVLVVRESPLTTIHLRNMLAVTEAGGIILPPVPAFYTRPASLDEVISQTAARVLDLFDIDVGALRRWGEDVGRPSPGHDGEGRRRDEPPAGSGLDPEADRRDPSGTPPLLDPGSALTGD